jgi:hypothetical protein
LLLLRDIHIHCVCALCFRSSSSSSSSSSTLTSSSSSASSLLLLVICLLLLLFAVVSYARSCCEVAACCHLLQQLLQTQEANAYASKCPGALNFKLAGATAVWPPIGRTCNRSLPTPSARLSLLHGATCTVPPPDYTAAADE